MTKKPNFQAHGKLPRWQQVALPLHSTCNFEWSEKAQETWQWLSPQLFPPSSPPYLFHWSLHLSIKLLKEHTTSPFPCLSLCRCSLHPPSLPILSWSLFTSQFAQNGQFRRRVLHLDILTSLSAPPPLLLSSVYEMCILISNQWTWNFVLGARSVVTKSTDKPTLNTALERGRKKLHKNWQE